MFRLRPGWLVALCAVILAVSAWLPWLTATADGGGRANAIGGIVGAMPVPPPGFGLGQLIVLLASTLVVAGAMAARGLSARMASSVALAISVLLVVADGLVLPALRVPAGIRGLRALHRSRGRARGGTAVGVGDAGGVVGHPEGVMSGFVEPVTLRATAG